MDQPIMQPTTRHRGRFAHGSYLFLVLCSFTLLLSSRANAQTTLSQRGPCVNGRVTTTKEFPIKRVRIVVGIDLPEAGEAVASPGGLFTLCFPESTRPGDLIPLKIFSLEDNVRRRLSIAGVAPGENGKVAVPGPRKRIKIRVTSIGREEQIAQAAREIRDGSSEPGRILERLAVSLAATSDDLAAEIKAWSQAQADAFDHNCLPLAVDQDSARYRECLDKIAPGIDSTTANRAVTLAWLQYSDGLYKEAENTLDPAKSLQPENPAILNALGAVERAQKKYKEADASYQDAVRLSLATRPAMNLELAASLSNFGELKGITGGCLDAELFQDWTLTIERKELGPAHQELAIALGRLSSLYAAAGRYDEADKLAKRALELWPKDKTSEPRYVRAASLNLLTNSADISRIRRQQDAADTYRRALELIQQDSNFEFPVKVRVLNGLSQVYLAEGNLGQADVNLSEAERIEAKNAFASRSPEAATTHYVRAEIDRGAKKSSASEEEFRVALDIGLEAFGEDSPFVLHCELALAQFLDDLGRGSEATSYKEDAQRIRETLTKAGCNHEDLAAAIRQPVN